MSIVGGIKTYKCKYCGRKYTTIEALNAHKRSIHRRK